MKKKFYSVTLLYDGTVCNSVIESSHPINVLTEIIVALAVGVSKITIQEIDIISDKQLFRSMAKAL